ncbi:hypothetical protein DWB77_07523 [Streptomyces hundungensis]|uniref:Uncharacterized protein n=1 Tax=Streptomyces hundungensis TaxID=1077946 RepID=A0A387HN01_9ACTN|nr:hypothetical protein [Streptomyces hundungensis]AYG77962.1 hypothetical protein DWB77_00069 [Streptomyces hundungensis]AYG85306.1 hypothetical protein DWB77_07523 [Streptomyces hundungensis]
MRPALAVLLKGSVPVSVGAFLLYGLDRAAAPSGGRHRFALEALAQALSQKAVPYVHAGVMVLAALVGVFALFAALECASDNRWLKALADAHGHYVLVDELSDPAWDLLRRAHRAQHVMLKSRVHGEDLIDRAANEYMFPAQLWEIALSLALYSKLCRQEPDHPQGTALISVLRDRRRALGAGLRGITSRVRALEDYAQQTAEADARYAELEQIRYLNDRSDQVPDLVARTAGDEHAVEEVEGKAAWAETVTDAFGQALREAQEAGREAFPR